MREVDDSIALSSPLWGEDSDRRDLVTKNSKCHNITPAHTRRKHAMKIRSRLIDARVSLMLAMIQAADT